MHRPLPLCSWHSARAPAQHTWCDSYWWHTLQTPCTAPWAGCSWSGSGIWGVGMRWWSSPLRHQLPWWGRWAGWPGTTAPRTDVQWCLRWGCLQVLSMCSFPWRKKVDISRDEHVSKEKLSLIKLRCTDFKNIIWKSEMSKEVHLKL